MQPTPGTPLTKFQLKTLGAMACAVREPVELRNGR